jgi:hypothetical protein
MGLWSTERDENTCLVSRSDSQWKRCPCLCHLDRRGHGRSAHRGGSKTLFRVSATNVNGSTALSFVISTEAYPDFLLRCTQQRPRMRLSEKRGARSLPITQLSTGNPGERSGEICSSAEPWQTCFFERGSSHKNGPHGFSCRNELALRRGL